jgi:hypothetical protein
MGCRCLETECEQRVVGEGSRTESQKETEPPKNKKGRRVV